MTDEKKTLAEEYLKEAHVEEHELVEKATEYGNMFLNVGCSAALVAEARGDVASIAEVSPVQHYMRALRYFEIFNIQDPALKARLKRKLEKYAMSSKSE